MVARRGHPGGRLVVVGRRRRLIGGGRLRATERGRLGRADGHPERREAADLVIGRTARVRDGGPGRGGHVVCRGRGRGRRAHGPRRVHRSSGVARPVVTARHDLRRVVASTAGGEPRGRTRDRRAPLGQGHAITGRRLAQHHPDPIAGGGASEAASGLGRRRRKGRAVRRRVVDGRNRRASARRAPRIRVGTEAARRVSIRVVRRSGRPRRSAGRTGVYGPSARPPVGFIGRARRGEEGAARLRRSSGQVRPASKVAPGARRVVDDVRSRRSNLVLVLAPPRALLLRPAAAAAAVPGARAVDAARLVPPRDFRKTARAAARDVRRRSAPHGEDRHLDRRGRRRRFKDGRLAPGAPETTGPRAGAPGRGLQGLFAQPARAVAPADPEAVVALRATVESGRQRARGDGGPGLRRHVLRVMFCVSGPRGALERVHCELVRADARVGVGHGDAGRGRRVVRTAELLPPRSAEAEARGQGAAPGDGDRVRRRISRGEAHPASVARAPGREEEALGRRGPGEEGGRARRGPQGEIGPAPQEGQGDDRGARARRDRGRDRRARRAGRRQARGDARTLPHAEEAAAPRRRRDDAHACQDAVGLCDGEEERLAEARYRVLRRGSRRAAGPGEAADRHLRVPERHPREAPRPYVRQRRGRRRVQRRSPGRRPRQRAAPRGERRGRSRGRGRGRGAPRRRERLRHRRHRARRGAGRRPARRARRTRRVDLPRAVPRGRGGVRVNSIFFLLV
mmetsp:Transcript_10844/g.33448  ORF Transcript_10844/g.33448 Transcript_10844/m.33448 type:complete len:740 (+) Transcript_10844:324-2543(+)